MPFGNHTPESLLPRSDSKNPATTCKGLTSSGRPCRRALAASVENSPLNWSAQNQNGVVAVLDEGAAAAFFCWQHKDQAESLVAKLQKRSKIIPLKQRSSIDTLIERVGVLDLDDEVEESTRPQRGKRDDRIRTSHQGMKKRDTMPQEWQNIQSPLMSLPEEDIEVQMSPQRRQSNANSRPPRNRYQSDRIGRSNVKASWSCCIQLADDDDLVAPRRRQQQNNRPRPQDQTKMHPPRQEADVPYQPTTSSTPIRRKPVNTPEMQQQASVTDRVHLTPTRPPLQPTISSSSPPNSQTASFLSLIPPHLSPSTTSALLSELSKPISNADEAGYIYIFWLTPESDSAKPDDDIASSLLDPDEYSPLPSPSNRMRLSNQDSPRQATKRLTAQALRRFASVKHGVAEPTKILLKIGRAANVHRRLSQWTKQCGQNITLIRYYPYQQSRSSGDMLSAQDQPKHMVPHVHRVERLIHLELADKRVTDKGVCEACGRSHKEWFEVDATKQGVKDVDEVVRRWVSWAEQTC